MKKELKDNVVEAVNKTICTCDTCNRVITAEEYDRGEGCCDECWEQ